jgi:hypothetical protein
MDAPAAMHLLLGDVRVSATHYGPAKHLRSGHFGRISPPTKYTKRPA